MFGKLCVDVCSFSTSHGKRVTQNVYSTKGASSLIQRIDNCFVRDNYLLLQLTDQLSMKNIYLKVRIHKRGLGLKRDCVMNVGEVPHHLMLFFFFFGNNYLNTCIFISLTELKKEGKRKKISCVPIGNVMCHQMFCIIYIETLRLYPGGKKKREFFMRQYSKYTRSYIEESETGQIRELLNMVPLCLEDESKHTGCTAFKIMHPAAELCTPGAGCTLNFQH